MRTVLLLLFAILDLQSKLAAASVFKCTTDNGAVTFTDRGCPATQRSETPSIIVSTVTRAPLTDQERQALDQVDRRQRNRRTFQETRRRQRLADRHRTRSERQQQCSRALAGLAEVRTTRRRGYALNKAKTLAARERALEILRADNCP